MAHNRDFIKTLEEQLDRLDSEQDRIIRIQQIDAQIDELKSQISKLEEERLHEAEQMMGDLAVSVRKAIPGINVGLNNGRCHVSHLSNMLSLRPDFATGVWDVEPNMTGRRFRRRHGHALGLKHDVCPLSNSVADFFRSKYKRLRPRSGVRNEAITPNMGRAVQNKGISKAQGSGYYA